MNKTKQKQTHRTKPMVAKGEVWWRVGIKNKKRK